MNGERLKTIGVDKDVWRRLKLLAMAKDCTLSDAVDYLLERSGEDGTQAGEAGEVGNGAGKEPGELD